MKFSVRTVSALLTSSSLAFAPPGKILDAGAIQNAFQATPGVTSRQRSGIRKTKLSLFGSGDESKKDSFKATYSVKKRFSPKEKLEEPKKGSLFFMNPQNAPIVRNWKENPNGSISGRISGSEEYKDDEFVTTSPLKSAPLANKVAVTKSGTKYFLVGPGSTLKDAVNGARTTSVSNTGGGDGGNNDNENAAVSLF